jgi:hypothetical protein
MGDALSRRRYLLMVRRAFAVPRLEAIIDQSHQVAAMLEQAVSKLETAVETADRRATEKPGSQRGPDEQRR